MRVLPFTIPKPESTAVMVQIDRGKQFYDRLHQHEEIQISMIVKGEGELVAGDRLVRYRPDDIFVVGGYMPHLLKSDVSVKGESHMISIFFTEVWFQHFLQTEEVREFSILLKQMNFGMILQSNKDEIKEHFVKIAEASPVQRLIHFLSILQLIGSGHNEVLSSVARRKSMSENEGLRMQRIMNHAMHSFHNPISLEEIAKIANLTPNAFCRYFKQRTEKTFFQFLNEIRLENASTLLRKNRDISIAEVSELSGFLNLSNFNRMFKREKGLTPSQFRKQKLT